MKRVTILMLLLSLICTGLAWSSGGSEATAAEEKVTLRGTKWQSYIEEKYQMEEWVNQYMEANPNITIEFEMVATGYGEKLIAGFAGGTGPDFYYLHIPNLPRQVQQGIPMPLDDYIDGPDGINRDDIFDSIWKATTYKGKTYGYSRSNGVQVLYYNKKMFDDVGLAYPDETWTWDDLAMAAKQLVKKDESGRISQFGFQCDEYNRVWLSHVWSNNGKVFDDRFEPTKALFNSPEGVAAAKYLVDLVQAFGVAPPPGVAGALGYREAFSTQKVAMILDGSWMIKSFSKKEGLEYGTTLVPQGKIRAGWYDVTAFMMASTTKYPDQTWGVVKNFSNVDRALEYADYGGDLLGGMPAWKTAYTDPRWKPTAISKPVADQMVFASAELTFYDSGKWFWSMLNAKLQEIVTLKRDPKEALDELAAETKSEILDKMP